MVCRILVFAFCLFYVCISCGKDDVPVVPSDPITSQNKILPLGASRVEGARPEFESYRYELWKILLLEGWNFDFLGTMEDPAYYPDYDGEQFDNDHEGRGGWTSGQILENIDDWLNETGSPDIVLFSSPGGNDALNGLSYEQAMANVNQIIDAIQNANPYVTIIIEQLAPARSDIMSPLLNMYFNRMHEDVQSIAQEQSNEKSKVICVDMAHGFNDSFLADEVHYNKEGAVFIARRYYEVLQHVLKE